MLRARINHETGYVHCGKRYCRGLLGNVRTEAAPPDGHPETLIWLRSEYKQHDGVWDFPKRARDRLAHAKYDRPRLSSKQIGLLRRPRRSGGSRRGEDGQMKAEYVSLEVDRMVSMQPIDLTAVVRCYVCRWQNELTLD
jgi:hypothetical protein